MKGFHGLIDSIKKALLQKNIPNSLRREEKPYPIRKTRNQNDQNIKEYPLPQGKTVVVLGEGLLGPSPPLLILGKKEEITGAKESQQTKQHKTTPPPLPPTPIYLKVWIHY